MSRCVRPEVPRRYIKSLNEVRSRDFYLYRIMVTSRRQFLGRDVNIMIQSVTYPKRTTPGAVKSRLHTPLFRDTKPPIVLDKIHNTWLLVTTPKFKEPYEISLWAKIASRDCYGCPVAKPDKVRHWGRIIESV